jgi:hypothetical protein
MTDQTDKRIDDLLERIKVLEQQAKVASCIACNGFVGGTGWCDRHRAMWESPNPLLAEMPMKEAPEGAHRFEVKTELP